MNEYQIGIYVGTWNAKTTNALATDTIKRVANRGFKRTSTHRPDLLRYQIKLDREEIRSIRRGLRTATGSSRVSIKQCAPRYTRTQSTTQ
jgi:hypothetical protein